MMSGLGGRYIIIHSIAIVTRSSVGRLIVPYTLNPKRGGGVNYLGPDNPQGSSDNNAETSVCFCGFLLLEGGHVKS